MSSKTSRCLAAAGITRIVWVDDFFASPSRDELAEATLGHILRLKERGSGKVDVPAFAAIDLARPKPEVEEACIEIMQNLGDEQLAEAVRQLAGLNGVVAVEQVAQPDLSPADFGELLGAFGDGLRTFSMATWTSTGVQQFGTAGDDTLFLIDREFSRERAGLDGIDLLTELVKTAGAFCILLTHTCTEAEQEQRRVDLAVEKGLPPHRFCVLSKRQSGGDSIDVRFAQAIRSVMTHRFNGELAYMISEVTQESARNTAGVLTRQSVSDLEQVLFENPAEEGVLEYDVLLRVFQIQRRYALNRALREERVQALIHRARNFRRKTTEFRSAKPLAEMTLFREWREREVFEDGAGLNALHAPLVCGDVFECEEKERCILLAQPCDLMIRENGRRRAQAGLLVLVNEYVGEAGKPSAGGARYFDLRGVFRDGKQWQVDFQNAVVVDLSVMDLAVFNADGSVQLRRDHAQPAIALTGGWTRRLNRAMGEFFPKGADPRVPAITIGRRAANLQGAVEGGWVKYPLRRVGRVEPATATAILAAWATFQTRAALDYDFARAESDSRGTPGQARPAGEPVPPTAGG
ncbi:MAG TPA: hypothetical protein VJA21_11040 [Verrucomicrobiae bacterium]